MTGVWRFHPRELKLSRSAAELCDLLAAGGIARIEVACVDAT